MKLIKILFIFCFVVIAFACSESNQSEDLQPVDIKSYVDAYGDQQLIGTINFEALREEPYAVWFTKAYNESQINAETASELKDYIKDFDIEVFFGTWCEDSQREVPVFYKILEDSDYELTQVQLVAVNGEEDSEEYKKSPTGETEGKNITNVPTIIFSKNGEEVNRIVESAVGNSLEEDVLAIVTGQNYSHKYADF